MKRMTDTQKSTIDEMRKSGLGYKAIAKEMQLSRDTVRSYCIRNRTANSEAEYACQPIITHSDHERTYEIRVGKTIFIVTTAYSESATETLEKKLERLILNYAATHD